MINVGIVGSTGYAGEELVRLLVNHGEVNIKFCYSKKFAGKKYYEVYKNFFNIIDKECAEEDLLKLSKEVDVIFTATPQGYLASILNDEILSNCKIIDLSADFRLKDVAVYEKWYKIEHKTMQYLNEAVYGLCEINRDKIKKARLIANPGCYTTCSILTLAPLVKSGIVDENSIIVDAKSGVSGAGRNEKIDNLYCEVNESVKAYGITTHRHTPEIEEQLSYISGKNVVINFTPHLIPMNRGILVSAYANIKSDKKLNYEDIKNIYKDFYKGEKFIRLLDENVYPETRCVRGSNYVDINFKIDERTNRILAFGAIDNLVKGAAGQAVQNMNLMFGLPEDTGLNVVPIIL